MQLDVYERLIVALENALGSLGAFFSLTTASLEGVLYEVLNNQDFNAYKEEIRGAVNFYFSSRGLRSLIFFKERRGLVLRVKVSDFETNIYTQTILSRFKAFSSLTQPIGSKKGVIGIDEQAEKVMRSILAKIADEEDKKEIIRTCLKMALALQPRDGIFFVDGRVLVKKFQEGEVGLQKRMFDGISEEVLDQVELDALNEGLNEKITQLAISLASDKLSFRKFDNFYFGKNFLRIFQEGFLLLLPSTVAKKDPATKQAYANFLLRKYFDTLMCSISAEILDALIRRDHKAEAFIRFYNGDIGFFPNGERFKKPEILDSQGQNWTSGTIIQILAQRRTLADKLEQNDVDIARTQQFIENITATIGELHTETIEKQKSIPQYDTAIKTVETSNRQLKSTLLELKTSADKQVGRKLSAKLTQENFQSILLKSRKLSQEVEDLIAEKKKMETLLDKMRGRILSLEEDRTAFEKKMQRTLEQREVIMEKLAPVEERYNGVVKSLAKAMSSFRGVAK